MEEKAGSCSVLHVYECPLSLIERAVESASDHVTVENHRPTRSPGEWADLSLELYPEDPVRTHRARSAVLDLAMSRVEFQSHMAFWDLHGVYAVFTGRGALGFRATDLDEKSRYRALRNYDWTLELAMPASSGNGWGSISSPDRAMIQQLREFAAIAYGGPEQ